MNEQYKNSESNNSKSDVSGEQNKFEDLKVTDDSNSKNVSVSEVTGDDDREMRRVSFISSKSRTKSFNARKPHILKFSFVQPN